MKYNLYLIYIFFYFWKEERVNFFKNFIDLLYDNKSNFKILNDINNKSNNESKNVQIIQILRIYFYKIRFVKTYFIKIS